MIRGLGISLRRGGRPVLEDVDLELRDGEVLVLVGPNGAGKSSLLGVLAGEFAPDTGEVLLDDLPIGSYPNAELARRRAVLTQENSVTFPFLVREIVAMGRAPWARHPVEEHDDDIVEAAMAETDVARFALRRTTELSGGERARVALARVLAQQTPVVLLDEPTAALDLGHQEQVMLLARRLAAQGRAVGVVLHDLSLAAAHADRIALLHEGRLVAVGPPAEVLTAELVGDVYDLPVRVVEIDGAPVVVPIRHGADG